MHRRAGVQAPSGCMRSLSKRSPNALAPPSQRAGKRPGPTGLLSMPLPSAAGQERAGIAVAGCSTSCSNPPEKRLRSGRTGWLDDKFRAEIDRFRHAWTSCRRVRDREAPGSNPGPPTKFRTQIHPRGGATVISPLCWRSSYVAVLPSRRLHLPDSPCQPVAENL